MMLDPQLFERNMLAIASQHGPLCADRVRFSASDPRVGISSSREGLLVPFVDLGDHHAYMHSRVDPIREAERLASEYKKPGFYAFLGLGAGYTVEALLAADRVSRGLIIEYEAGILRAVLERLDLTHVLGDRRLKLLVDPTDEELDSAVSSTYVPAVNGYFGTIPLRGRTDAAPESYKRAADVIRGTISVISDDYSVQSFFGKRWFSNIVRNLAVSARPTPPVGPIREAVVTAAGPSLELYFDDIANRPRGAFLIATDTSLRALLERGITPDAVISIDCQHISYYHFTLGLPENTPLFLDLASPPTVTRMATRPYFFSSGHPLSRYITSRFRAFPVLDTSGGNVTHAAVSLAEYLGASTIRLYGADFSYPFGKTYARGTYIYPYFDIRQSRTHPLEALFSDFLYRNHSLTREDDGDGCFRYVTKPLVAYRERLEKLSSMLSCTLDRVRGYGVVTTNTVDVPPTGSRSTGRVFAAGRAFQSPEQFLSTYASDIQSLPTPYRHASSYLDGLGAHEKDVWTTMLPSAAAFHREAGDNTLEPSELLAQTRSWCELVVRQELSRGAD
ncbi:MAG: motility associated factor glycosyltransferase family protein [Spirochaetales bacterium]|nr:motility associated factor glycosyltransferase family protein [Spirochaetales bacterium]